MKTTMTVQKISCRLVLLLVHKYHIINISKFNEI